MRKEDLQEEEAIEKFFRNGCGCADNCYKHFSESYIRTRRSDMLELTRNEYDLVIMAQIRLEIIMLFFLGMILFLNSPIPCYYSFEVSS